MTMKTWQYFLTALCLVAFSCSEDNEVILNPQPFVGDWVIIEVAKDNAFQPAWTSTRLIIDQNSETGGTFQMLSTPYDTIWSATGTWSTADALNTFMLNDTLRVDYSYRNDTLHLTKFLPWTSIPCTPPSGPCLTVQTGQWDFALHKRQ